MPIVKVDQQGTVMLGTQARTLIPRQEGVVTHSGGGFNDFQEICVGHSTLECIKMARLIERAKGNCQEVVHKLLAKAFPKMHYIDIQQVAQSVQENEFELVPQVCAVTFFD